MLHLVVKLKTRQFQSNSNLPLKFFVQFVVNIKLWYEEILQSHMHVSLAIVHLREVFYFEHYRTKGLQIILLKLKKLQAN